MSHKRDDNDTLGLESEAQQDQALTEAFHDDVDYREGNKADQENWNKNSFGKAVSGRSGKFTKEETETLRNAVNEYCAMKQITVKRLCSECDHKADLKGSWLEIAKSLPHRSVQSVYRHGLRQLHPFKRGNWSEEEVEHLIMLVTLHGKKWAQIQRKLNRSADSCRDKYRELDDSYIRGRWKDEETAKLQSLIREYLRAHPKSEMTELGKMVEAEQIKIPWSTISKRMENRSRLSCFKKWQKMTGLYSASDIGRVEPSYRTNPNGPGKSQAAAPAIAEEPPDMDVLLLKEIASQDCAKASDIGWEELRIENAEERLYELLEDWQSSIMDEAMLALPISEIAQLIIDQKASAQRAAETVEAVDLPETF
mmetsp:Transcript_3398/g.9492  ORF Transcript_3398/g.9492 Transcript_3398/m.9492 type:complete len:367 (-) Transcript_3398:343-1443(-)